MGEDFIFIPKNADWTYCCQSKVQISPFGLSFYFATPLWVGRSRAVTVADIPHQSEGNHFFYLPNVFPRPLRVPACQFLILARFWLCATCAVTPSQEFAPTWTSQVFVLWNARKLHPNDGLHKFTRAYSDRELVMDTISVVLKTGYKIVKDFTEQHKPVSLSNRLYLLGVNKLGMSWFCRRPICVTPRVLINGYRAPADVLPITELYLTNEYEFTWETLED